MTTHTRIPWHQDDTAIFADGGVLARIPNHPDNGRNWAEDAAFIIKAVNSHDALVNLVQTLLDNDPDEPIADNGATVLDGWRQRAREVLHTIG